MASTNPTIQPPSTDPQAWRAFEAESSAVIQRLRTALAEVVAAVPGTVSTPTELQRALRVDMNVCCKILKVVSTAGTLHAGLQLPGLMALRSFLKGARRAGVPDGVVESASGAADEFDRLVSTHADDRTTFDSMVSSLVGSEDAEQITFQHRRATFRGQRHLFGMHARVQLKCLIIQPEADDPRLLDLANLGGFVALRLLRPAAAPIALTPAYTTNDDGAVRVVHREPLAPEAPNTAGVSLLPEFCSRPTVQLHAAPALPGQVIGDLIGIGVGNTAAVDCVEGHLNRAAVPRYREPDNRIGGHLAEVRVPCETLLLDLLVHEDAFGPLQPRASARADHLAEVRFHGSAAWQPLPASESVRYLGKGPSVLYTPEYPRYPELGRYAFQRLGWAGERFDVYRCRVEYPVLPSTIAMFFDLPEAPAE